MNRCDACGRTGGAMTPIRSRWVDRIIACRCRNVGACNERVRRLGKWVGTRVLRRTELDGTEWTIRRHDGTGLSSSGPWCVLTCTYRDLRLSSMHSGPDAAKAHADDLLASWRARSMQDYAKGRG